MSGRPQVPSSLKKRVRWPDEVDEDEEDIGFSIGGASRRQVGHVPGTCQVFKMTAEGNSAGDACFSIGRALWQQVGLCFSPLSNVCFVVERHFFED